MDARKLMGATLLALLAAGAVGVEAQRGQSAGADEPSAATPEVRLIYERENFRYSADNRRDPFAPLTAGAGLGPRFEELSLLGVIYSNIPDQSMAVLADASGTRYRVKRGDVIGNVRVVDIGPLRVVLAVDNFGVVTNEVLEIRRNREGASG